MIKNTELLKVPLATEETVPFQRPDVGIAEIVNDQLRVSLSETRFPWIPEVESVQTAEVTLETGERFRYGSLVGEHGSMIKFAKSVSSEESHKSEIGLFKALPEIIRPNNANLPKNIDIVPGFVGIEGATIYKVAKQGRNAARLYFTILPASKESPVPLVVKLGIAPHDKQIAMQNIMSGNRTRQKHDG
jgi:hypothetical protein